MKGKISILILGSIATFLALGDRYVISSLYLELMKHYSLHSTVIFSFLFSSFYLGYTITQVPGGRLAQKYGPSRVAGISMIAWSVLFILLPITHTFSVSIATAFILGVSQGPIFPSVIYLVRLFNRDREYATASGIIGAAGNISPAIIPLASLGFIYLTGNLEIPFVFFGLLGIAGGIFFVSMRTKETRNDHLRNFRTFLTKRFIVFGLSFLVYDFFFYVFLTWFPYFLRARFSIPPDDFLFSSVPWIFMSGTAVLFGILLDRINRDGMISQVSYVLVAISVVGMALSRNPFLFLFFVAVGLSFLNPILISSWRLSTRLAGEENSSFVGGWMNFWGNVGGILAPVIIASLDEIVGLTKTFLISVIVPIIGLGTWIIMSRWKFDEE